MQELRNSEEIIWFHTSPIVGKPLYPLILDIAESAKQLSHDNLVELACSALAPTFEELGSFGLVGASGPRRDDINDFDIWDQYYLLWALARSIASLGKHFGVVLRDPELYDNVSKRFVDLNILSY
ncbi:MAG: hypothetical protein WB988_12225 [Candidatus Nitrosopolaris sp.]